MANTPIDDVLDQIFLACPASSLAVLSLVSSHIRTLALPHLLRTVSFDRNPQELHCFLTFIVNNTQSRDVVNPDVGPQTEIFGAGRYLLHLKIMGLAFHTTVKIGRDLVDAEHEEYPISTWAPILTRALALMPNLHSIVIQDCVEEIVLHSSDFAFTVLSRPQLTYIDLRGVGLLASNRFGQALNLKKDFMKLKTVKLSVQEDLEQMEQLELIPGEGMGSVLFHSRGDLTDLLLEMWDIRNLLRHDASGEGGHETKTPVVFPKVVALSLDDCDVSLKDLANSFPAVRTLTLGFSPFLLNIAPSETQTIPFPNLISLQGRYKDLRAFLQSTVGHGRVSRVVVDYPWKSNDDDTAPFAVTRALPALKILHFTHTEIMPLSWWKAFVHTTPHLTYLAVLVQPLTVVIPEDTLNLLCVHVPRILASSPLAYISLTLKGSEFAVDDDASPESQSLSTDEAMALSYATNIPTLKYIDIFKEIELFTGLTSWWSVVRRTSVLGDDIGVQVKALDACEGEAIRSWYDLET